MRVLKVMENMYNIIAKGVVVHARGMSICHVICTAVTRFKYTGRLNGILLNLQKDLEKRGAFWATKTCQKFLQNGY